jgi:hypothetical protein
MVQFIITIAEQDGAASVHLTRGQENPTELETAVLEQACRMGFARHSDAIQKLAERSLKQLSRKTLFSSVPSDHS